MDERKGYGDADAKRIIERAAEIDAEHGRQLNEPALREIALEAGISPAAVDKALEEHRTAAPAPVSWLKRYRAMLTVAAVIVALVLFFTFARMVPPSP